MARANLPALGSYKFILVDKINCMFDFVYLTTIRLPFLVHTFINATKSAFNH